MGRAAGLRLLVLAAVGAWALGAGCVGVVGQPPDIAGDAARDSRAPELPGGGEDSGESDSRKRDSADSARDVDGGDTCASDPPVRCLLATLVAPYVDPQGRPGRAPGLVVGVARPGNRYVGGFGATSRGGATAPRADSLFEIGSVTKVFTGYLLARALGRGELALDDLAEERLGVGAPSYDGRRITLLDLATHTSGLPLFPNNLLRPGEVNPAAGYTLALLEDFLASYELRVRPGARYHYSNLGAGVLGQILVTAAGESDYGALVAREIAAPLEIMDTLVSPGPAQWDRVVPGHAAGEPAPAVDIGAPLQGAGALRATGDELLRFFEGALDGEDAAWVEVATARRPSPNGTDGATGLLLNVERPGVGALYSKSGATPGFKSQVAFTLEPPLLVVLLANDSGTEGLYELATEILTALAGAADFPTRQDRP